MDRFAIETNGKGVCWIKDCFAKEYGMPERAVAINFKGFRRAETVRNLLNAEWQEFEHNPE